MATALPYPFERWPRMSVADARWITAWSRRYDLTTEQSSRELLRALLGTAITWTCGLANVPSRRDPQAVVLAIDGDAQVFVEVPATLSAWIADRALGGDAELHSLDAGLTTRDEVSLGVIAYVAARVLACLPGDLRVVDVVSPSRAMTHVEEVSCGFVLRVHVAATETNVKLWLARSHSTQTVSAHPNVALLEVLLSTRAVLSAQLTRDGCLSALQFAQLRLGDVILLPHNTLTIVDGRWSGVLQVGVLGATRDRWLVNIVDDRLELQSRSALENPQMTSKPPSNPPPTSDVLTAVGDAPLDIVVEIARFTLPLNDIASLGHGDVLQTGRPIGEAVTLRVGTRAIATGELVDINGTIGVRINSVATSS